MAQRRMDLSAKPALSSGDIMPGILPSISERYRFSFPTLATGWSSCTSEEAISQETAVSRSSDATAGKCRKSRISAKLRIIRQFSAASASIILSTRGLTDQTDAVTLLVSRENTMVSPPAEEGRM